MSRRHPEPAAQRLAAVNKALKCVDGNIYRLAGLKAEQARIRRRMAADGGLPTGEPATEMLHLRITPTERDQLQTAADRRNQTVTELVREAFSRLLDAIRDEA